MDAFDAETRKIKSLADENMWMLSDMLLWRNKYENLLRTVNGVVEHRIEEVSECESDQEVRNVMVQVTGSEGQQVSEEL